MEVTPQTLWEFVKTLEDRVLETPDQFQPFEVLAVDNNLVYIKTTGSGEEHEVPRDQIEWVYRILKDKKKVRMKQVQKEIKSVHTSYIFSMLVEHEDIYLDRRPVRLTWRRQPPPSVPQSRIA